MYTEINNEKVRSKKSIFSLFKSFSSCSSTLQCLLCSVLCSRPRSFIDALTTINASVVSSGTSCPNCATNNAGKHSCCARGGAWFKNCGDVGETQFDHTWSEGIQACKDFAMLVSGKAPMKVMFRHQEGAVHPVAPSQTRNDTQRHPDIQRPVSVSSTATMESENCNEVLNSVVCVCSWLINLIL